MTVAKQSLTTERTLGEGGFGTVHLVKTSTGQRFAYKEFKKPSLDEVANLRLLIEFRDALPTVDRDELDGFALWPLELVTDATVVSGYLMEVLPDRFVEQAIVQTSGTTKTPRTLDWLSDPARAKQRGASLVIAESDIANRATYAAMIASAFAFLHRRGVVFGDVSPINVLYADDPSEIRLIDLDSARLLGRSPQFRQPHTTGMAPPECRAGQREQTIETDLFKLGYLFFTVLASVLQVSNSAQTVGRVDAPGMALFGRALGADATARPTAIDWYRYLYDRVGAVTNPPTLQDFEASPGYGLRGEPIQLRWTAAGYRSLILHMPSGESRDLGVSATNELNVALDRAGRFMLTAENEHGTVVAETGIVRMFEPPAIKFVDVPTFKSLEHCSLGVSDADMQAIVDAGSGFDWVDTMLSTTLPAIPLPFAAMDDVVTPPFTRNELDWSGLNKLVNDAFRGPRAEDNTVGWLKRVKKRLARK